MVLDGLRAGVALGRGAAARAAGLPRAAASAVLGGAPDRTRALDRYEGVAAGYDALTAGGGWYRKRSVDALELRRGETVIEVGCGTGLNLPGLSAGVGPQGRVVGIDQSRDMLARAAVRMRTAESVTLVQAPAEEADVPLLADAALLCGTHDILRSERALRNVLRHVRPGGRVVAGGAKWAPWWRPGSVALNTWTWQINRPYVTTFEGFDRPWSLLERLVPGLQIQEILFGGGYIAVGRTPVERSAAATPTRPGSSPRSTSRRSPGHFASSASVR